MFFEDMFPWKKTWENYSLKRTVKANLSNHHIKNMMKLSL
jgi:hypothetical protein